MMGKLLPFMKFLEKEAGFKFNIEKFEHRLMLQKYVFISKFFEFNHGYLHSILRDLIRQHLLMTITN